METIFDHNPTEEEIINLLIFPITKEILDSCDISQERHYRLIFKLYALRENKEMMKNYYDLLPNDIYKAFELTAHDWN